jgi:Putative prokaryotic signal transducing protein
MRSSPEFGDRVSATGDPEELVPLRTSDDPQEAAVLKSVLEAAQIFCVVQAEHHRSMLGIFGAFISPVLLVRAGDVERAEAALAEAEPHDASAVAEPSGASELAPSLAPTSIEEEVHARAHRHRRRRIVAWTALAMLAGPNAAFSLANAVSKGTHVIQSLRGR